MSEQSAPYTTKADAGDETPIGALPAGLAGPYLAPVVANEAEIARIKAAYAQGRYPPPIITDKRMEVVNVAALRQSRARAVRAWRERRKRERVAHLERARQVMAEWLALDTARPALEGAE